MITAFRLCIAPKRVCGLFAISVALLSAALDAQSATPQITAIVNGASFVDGPLSPGEIVAITGTGLGPSTPVSVQLDGTGPVRTNLSDVRVLFDNVAAPLLFASGDRVYAIVPSSVAGKASTRVLVAYGALTSAPADRPVGLAAPGIFTLQGSGSGPATIANPDGSLNTSATPAVPGSAVTLYLTGGGAVDPSGVDGSIAPDNARMALPVMVWIAGHQAKVLYAGSVTGYVYGLASVQAEIPRDLAHGGDLPLLVQVGESTSQSDVTVSVAGPPAPGLTAPTNLSASLGSEQVVLAWKAADDATAGFRVERSASAGPFREIATLPANSFTFVDSFVQPETTYTYRVRAANDWAFSGYSNQVSVTLPSISPASSLLISQVYVNNIFGARMYGANYAEILNTGDRAVSLDGLSVQAYFSKWRAIPLSGSLLPGQRYLVSMAYSDLGSGGVPNADASGQAGLSSFVGSVAIIRGIEPLGTQWPFPEFVQTQWPASVQTVDLFGYGDQGRLDNIYNGRPFWGPIGTMAFWRKQNGCQNTRDNAADFFSAPPEPHNSHSPLVPCPASTRAPSFASSGLRNAATLRSGPLAPGTLAILEGEGFMAGGTQVSFDSWPAPIYAISTRRILLMVPKGLAGRSTANVIVRVNGLDSSSIPVALAATSPGVFSASSAQLSALPPVNEDGRQNGPESPASPGSTLLLSVTGVGIPPAGLAVFIGSQAAQVLDSVPVPGFTIALYRLRIRIPSGLSGSQPVSLKAGDVVSPTEFIYLPLPAPAHTDFAALRVGARDIAYDPYRNLIYAATAPDAPAQANSILLIDPISRSTVASIPCGTGPYRLALSARGRYLWIALNTDQAVQRIDLETRQIEFTLGIKEIFSDQPGLQEWIGVSSMLPDPGDDEVLVVSSYRTSSQTNPLIVLDGRRRRVRLGPPVDSVVFNQDHTLWTNLYQLAIEPDGVSVLRTIAPGELTVPVMLPIPGLILDAAGVLRHPTDLHRTGQLFFQTAIHGIEPAAYSPQTGLVYFGGATGGYENYRIEAFDPIRMLPVAEFGFSYHLVPPEQRPDYNYASRLLPIGPEGFATVFSDSRAGGGSHNGGSVFFFPHSVLVPSPDYPLPAPQTANGSVRRFPIPVQGASVDPQSGNVFFSLSSFLPGVGNAILPFDPVGGSFGSPVWVGSQPYVSRVTPDGRYLYVLLYGASSIRRLKLPDLQPDLNFPIYGDQGVPIKATALLDVPGADSTSVAVERADFLGSGAGVAIYDQGVRRPNTACCPNSTQFSDTGNFLFGINNETSSFDFYRWVLKPDGLELDATQRGLSAGYYASLRCFDSLCATSSGVLFDPITMVRVRMFGDPYSDAYGNFTSDTLLAVDPKRDRVYFLRGAGNGALQSYEISTGKLAGSLPGPYSGADIQLLPSGDLMVSGGNEVILIPAHLLP